MIVEGVNFVDEVCKSMTKEEFVAKFVDVFWTDRPVKERKRILSDTYSLLNPPAKPGKK